MVITESIIVSENENRSLSSSVQLSKLPISKLETSISISPKIGMITVTIPVLHRGVGALPSTTLTLREQLATLLQPSSTSQNRICSPIGIESDMESDNAVVSITPSENKSNLNRMC